MISGLDLLGQSGEAKVEKTGLDLLVPREAPTTEAPVSIEPIRQQLRREAAGLLAEETPVAISPLGGTAGLRAVMGLDTAEYDRFATKPIIDIDEFVEGATETLSGLKTLATRPRHLYRGIIGALASVAAFPIGAIFGGRDAVQTLMGGGSLEDAYESFHNAIAEAEKLFGSEALTPLIGPETKESRLVSGIVFSPITGISMIFNKLAESVIPELVSRSVEYTPILNRFLSEPNVRGAIKFYGDKVALTSMGRILHPTKRAETAGKIEDIADRAVKVAKVEEAVEKIPDEAVKRAQEKILEYEKKKLEAEAAEIAENIDYTTMIKEDLQAKGRRIKKVKQAKKYIADEAIHKAIESIKEKKAKPRKKTKVERKPTADEDLRLIKEVEDHFGKKIDELSDKEIEDYFLEKYGEEITDVDEQTGTREPLELSTDNSPFRERNPEVTRKKREILAEKKQFDSPETIVEKHIVDVNSWLDGAEDVDIVKAREALSDLAVAVKDPANRIPLLDYFNGDSAAVNNFIEVAEEAAKWARRADRSKIERTGELPEVQLNIMIPVEEIPKSVWKFLVTSKQFAKRIFDEKGLFVKDVYRNKELFDKTSFWYGRDGKWRYEIDDSKATLKLPKDRRSLDGFSTTLGEILDYPELYKAVPEIKNMRVYFRDLGSDAGQYVSGGFRALGKGYIAINPYRSGNIKRTLFHELQHAVNDTVGSKFLGADARTTSSYFEYLTDPGEMEARLASRRMSMSREERRKTPPWKSLDRMLRIESSTKDIRMRAKYGTRLYSGIPIDKAIESIKKVLEKRTKKIITREDLQKFPEEQRNVIADALAYKEAFNKDEIASKKSRKLTFKDITRLGPEGIWDVMHESRKMLLKGMRTGKLDKHAERVLWQMVNEKGGHGYGQLMFMQFRKEVYGGLSAAKKSILNKLIRGKRIEDIANYKPKVKFPKDQSFNNAIAYGHLFEAIEGLSHEEALDLSRRRDAYFEWMNKLVDFRREKGLISEEMAEGLKTHNYARFKGIGQRLERGEGIPIEKLYDEKETVRVGGRVRSVNSSGIESLQPGKMSDILETDQELVALEIFNRVYGQAFRNDTFRELAELARKNPDNPIVRLPRKDAHPDQPKIKDTRLWAKFNYIEDGKKKSIYIDRVFARGLEALGKDVSPRAVAWSSNLALAKPARVMMTGAAPLWSIFVNLPRDIFHTYMAAGRYEGGRFKQIYSPVPPVFAAQLGRDYAATFYDVFFRRHKTMQRKRYVKAAEHGLLMPFLSTQARTSVTGYKLPGKFAPLENFFLYLPESLEMWTRVAIAERVLRQRAKEAGVSLEEIRRSSDAMKEAVFVARDYLDFQQGGWWIKMQDQLGKIYLNAGVQAMRTFGRAIKENPKQAILRLGQTIGIPTVLVVAASKLYAPKTSRDIPEYMHDNNFVIPFPDSFRFTGKDGQEYGLVLTIPLDSGAAFFKNLFRGLTEKFMYEAGLTDEEPNYEAILGSLTKTAPDIMSLPPSHRAVMEYLLNIDFWTRKSISPKTFKYPDSMEEYIKGKTSELAIDVGKVTGLSPERLERVKRAILGDNIWTYAVGKGYDEAFGDIPKEMREEHLALVLAEIPGVKRFIKVVRAGGGRIEKQKEILEKIDLADFINSRNVDFYAKLYHWYGKKDAKKEFIDYVTDKERVKTLDEKERLIKRWEFIRAIKDLPDRSSWANMWYKSPEAKARDYVDRLRAAKTEEEKEELKRKLDILIKAGGYVTPRFRYEVSRLLHEK